MVETRVHFHEELEEIERQALGGIDLVEKSLRRTIEALVQADAELAALVIDDDDLIDGRYLEVHQRLLSLLALQAPVARDLRLIAALLHSIKHIERMGDQCVNICKVVPKVLDSPPTQTALVERIERMGELCISLITQVKQAFLSRDVALAEDLVRQDDAIDDLNKECFKIALDVGVDHDLREWAMHMILVARYLERIGDYAVDIGEQTAFAVTGLFREFSDTSSHRIDK